MLRWGWWRGRRFRLAVAGEVVSVERQLQVCVKQRDLRVGCVVVWPALQLVLVVVQLLVWVGLELQVLEMLSRMLPVLGLGLERQVLERLQLCVLREPLVLELLVLEMLVLQLLLLKLVLETRVLERVLERWVLQWVLKALVLELVLGMLVL